MCDYSNEEWRDIEGCEGYQISTLGRVYSKKTSKILRPTKHTSGYLQVRPFVNGKHVNKFIHRLVGEAFIPREEGKNEVNHIDEDKTNNAVTNLEWCDQAYNNAFGTGPARRAAKWTPDNARLATIKPVLQYDLEGNFIKRWDSLTEVNRELGFSMASISSACNRRNECQYIHGITHGYRWDFDGVNYD